MQFDDTGLVHLIRAGALLRLQVFQIKSKFSRAACVALSLALLACGELDAINRTEPTATSSSDPSEPIVGKPALSTDLRTTKSSHAECSQPAGRLSATDAQYQRYFGPGLNAAFTSLTSFNGIGNISGIEYRVSQRLRVPPGISGTIKSVRYYSPSGVGYASGTGGAMRFKVLPDDGTAAHLPLTSATPLAQGDFLPANRGMVAGAYSLPGDQFQTVQLNAVAKLPIAAGQLIHIYTSELALDPANWSGVNLRTQTESQKSPNRWLEFVDAGVQIFTGPPGFATPSNVFEATLAPYSPSLPDGGYRVYPLIAVEMDNGRSFGYADMETYSYGANDITLAPGGKLVERFNLANRKIVDCLSLRFAARAAGILAWRIRGINGGAIRASGTLNVAANFSQIDTFGSGFLTDALHWVDIPLFPYVALNPGDPFDVELEALSGSFAFAGTVNGSEYGFTSPAAYTESSGLVWNGSSYVKLFDSPIGSTPGCCNLDVMFRAALPIAKNDFNRDGKSDLLWRNTVTGTVDLWLLSGPNLLSALDLSVGVSLDWSLQGAGDYSGDGSSDLLWRHLPSGLVYVWSISNTPNGSMTFSGFGSPGRRSAEWTIQDTGDFNGDGKSDILWRNSVTGTVDLWLMNGPSLIRALDLSIGVSLDWSLQGTGDYSGDGTSDLLWRHLPSGLIYIWTLSNTANGSMTFSSFGSPGRRSAEWVIQDTGDFNGDGKSDILWRNFVTGTVNLWLMNGTNLIRAFDLSIGVSLDWSLQGTGDYSGDGTSDLLWRHVPSGQIYVWTLSNTSAGSMTFNEFGSPGSRNALWVIQQAGW